MPLSDYDVIREIGNGGMGTVFLARDSKLDRFVAIKKIKIDPKLSEDNKIETIRRFSREARTIANFKHPNIVKIYLFDQGIQENDYYIVMEYAEGKTLEQLMEEHSLSVKNILDIAIQACEALHYIHQKQTIHRDIKPSNLILSEKGVLKLMDFGIARANDNLDLTRVDTLLGTIPYMAPEQIINPKDIDYKIDIYALGITLYKLLCGHFPFSADNVWDFMEKALAGKPIPLRKLNPDIPYELESIIMKAIDKDKNKRYENMLEFLETIESFNLRNINPSNLLDYEDTTETSFLENYGNPLSISNEDIYDNADNTRRLFKNVTVAEKIFNKFQNKTQLVRNINFSESIINMDPNKTQSIGNITEKIRLEQRQKSFQSILGQIKNTNSFTLKENSNDFINKIDSLKTKDLPVSMVNLIKFCFSAKAKLPSESNRKVILEELNKEKDKLMNLEIEFTCKLFKMEFDKEKGFFSGENVVTRKS